MGSIWKRSHAYLRTAAAVDVLLRVRVERVSEAELSTAKPCLILSFLSALHSVATTSVRSILFYSVKEFHLSA